MNIYSMVNKITKYKHKNIILFCLIVLSILLKLIYIYGDIIQLGRMLMLHIKYPSSNLGISIYSIQAQVTQLVEWNIEAIFVVSSSLTLGNKLYAILV